MDIATARADIKNALANISGLHIYDTVPDSPITPCAIVYPETVNYEESFTSPAAVFVIHLLTPSVNAPAGQNLLDSYLASSGNTSIPALLRGKALTAATATVREMRNYGTRQLDSGARYYSAEIVVDIFA